MRSGDGVIILSYKSLKERIQSMGMFDWTLNRMASAGGKSDIVTLQAKTTGGLTSEIQKFMRKGYVMQGGISTNFEYGRAVYYATMIRTAEPDPSKMEQFTQKLEEETEKLKKEKLEKELELKRKELEELDEKIKAKQDQLSSEKESESKPQSKSSPDKKPEPELDLKTSIKNNLAKQKQDIKKSIKNNLDIDKKKAKMKNSLKGFIDKI